VFRTLRRLTVVWLRAAEAVALSLGHRPWKIDKFNRLIQPDIQVALKDIRSASVIVGIPFHKESGNIGALVETVQRDLELRGQNAAIVIVGERKTRTVLLGAELPPSTALVKIAIFCKPFGFAQRPGLTRRSWSHWAILQVASRLHADVVFIDADVRNARGWVNQYLDVIQKKGADLAVANYVRRFDEDDAIVHIWDRLIFGAVFRKWIAFRHGGDYAISHKLLPGILDDVSIIRERAYTMDSAVMAHVVRGGGRIESVWLGAKEHEPITRLNLFNRLQSLVHSVFDDVDKHLPRVLTLTSGAGSTQPPQLPATPGSFMRDLIGPDFRQDLHQDMAARFPAAADDIRRTLGVAAFERFASIASEPSAKEVSLSPRHWSDATIRFLAHYARSQDRARKSRLARACVPILEAGILAFLNRTIDLTYAEAFQCLDTEYLPVFQRTWESLSRRLVLYRLSLLRPPNRGWTGGFLRCWRRVLRTLRF
jgi:hypothetical protein